MTIQFASALIDRNSRDDVSTILVIEDDTDLRDVVSQMLEHAGYNVIRGANGLAALSALRSQRVDLLITDIVMPEKEGIETILEIRKFYPATKIIATSGNESYLDMASQLGSDRIITKPFEMDAMIDTVRALLHCGKSNP